MEGELYTLSFHQIKEPAPMFVSSNEVVTDTIPPHTIVLGAPIKFLNILVKTLGVDLPGRGVEWHILKKISSRSWRICVDGGTQW